VKSEVAFALRQGANHLALRAGYALDRPLGKPTQVTALITEACAARCCMCDIWKTPPAQEMAADEWKEVLDRLAEWLGPFFFVMSGGEPFQKPGIFEILAHCRSLGVKTKISTNGMYMTPATCDRVLEVGPDFLSFSIDHHDREVHDRLRGVPLHDRSVSAIRRLRAADSRVVLGVATIVMEETYRALSDTAAWARDLGVDRILFQPLYPTFAGGPADADWFTGNPHWPRDAAAVGAELDRLREAKRAGLPIWNPDAHLDAMRYYFRDPASHPRPDECMVRYHTFNIDPRGGVTFCYTVDDPAGNLRDTLPGTIWASAQAQSVRDKMRFCRAPCLLNCYRGRSLREQVGIFRLFARRQGF
jgi:MoaA/NifB/PqqE/SkfB family radical SAM enzyme